MKPTLGGPCPVCGCGAGAISRQPGTGDPWKPGTHNGVLYCGFCMVMFTGTELTLGQRSTGDLRALRAAVEAELARRPPEAA